MKRLIEYKKYIPIVFVVLLGLIPLLWFLGRGNVLINGVDTNFPLDPLIWIKRRFFMWNTIVNAGADFSSAPAGLFFHLVQLIPYVLGFSLQTVQKISLVFWFSLITLSSYLFAKALFEKKPWVQVLFTVLYSLNIYLFNSWENVKVANISLVSAIPLALYIFLKLKDKKISYGKAGFYTALIGVVLSGAGINPAYFLSFFVLFFIFVLSCAVSADSFRSFLSAFKNFVFMVFVLVLVNLYWILPTTNFVLGNIARQGSIDTIGFNNWIDSLSQNTSILNVLRLQGAWDWYALDSASGLPLYIPYVVNFFYRIPFLVFSFLVPLLSILSFILKDRKQKELYIAFALMLIVGVFLGVGTHLPTGTFFRWLLVHVPYFSLFRSPWYIFSPLVILSVAGLASLFFSSLYERCKKKPKRGFKFLLNIVIAVLIVGNLLYSYPLVTGKIFRPKRLDSFFINFPSYLFEAGEWLSKTDKGRLITYPEDELEKFDWGYIGVEPVLSLFVDNELVFPSINNVNSSTAVMIRKFYEKLKKGEMESAINIAKKLNIGLILEKKDQQTLSPGLNESIRALSTKRFGKWSFYELPDYRNGLPKLFPGKIFLLGYPYGSESTDLLTVLGQDQHLLNPDDDVIKKIPSINQLAGRVVLASNSQNEEYKRFVSSEFKTADRLKQRDFSSVKYTLDIPEEGYYTPALENHGLDTSHLSGNLEILHNGGQESWSINNITDSYIYFSKIFLNKGNHEVLLQLGEKNLLLKEDFEGGVRYKENSHDNKEVVYEVKGEKGQRFLSILNRGNQDVSAEFKVPSFDSMAPYYVSLEYKSVHGNLATCLVSQNTFRTLVKTQVESLPYNSEMVSYGFYYEPVKTDSEMKISLVAPFIENPFGTKVYYDNINVYKIFTSNLMFVEEGEKLSTFPVVEIIKNSPVKYEGVVKEAAGSHILIFSENYSREWGLVITDVEGKNFGLNPSHFSVDYYANAWYIENAPQAYKFSIYYKPQRLFNIGLFISVSGFIFLAIVLLRERLSRKDNEKN